MDQKFHMSDARACDNTRARHLASIRQFVCFVSLLTQICCHVQAKHASGEHSFGINGDTGKVDDMKKYGLYESASVKIQTLKTAIEVRFPSLSLSLRSRMVSGVLAQPVSIGSPDLGQPRGFRV